MLAYRSNITKWPSVFNANAVSYVVTRVVVTAVCFWTWFNSISVVWSGDQFSFYSFAFFLFHPVGNLILGTTQVQTILALFGIARSMQKMAHNTLKTTSSTDALIELADIEA